MSHANLSLRERDRLSLTRGDLFREAARIGDRWCESEKRLCVRNPATGHELGFVPDLGSTETKAAIDVAALAFIDWRERPSKERSTLLRAWFDIILKHKEDLARILTAEQGKPLAEARAEIAYAAAFIEWFAEEAKRCYGDVIPGAAANGKIWVDKRPVGVVAAITPWNFPAAMVTRKVAPALAAGCTVVLKPSELTPFTALAFARLSEEAGIPPGVFNVVTGAPAAIGDVLVEDDRIAKFTFTGSTGVGKALAARCMATVKRVSLELGGNAPFIVFDDADLDRVVAGAMASKFRNAGQTCVCANRFLVQSGIYEKFAEGLAASAAALRVGDGLSGQSDQGPLIDARAVAKVEAHVADALSGGARVLVGGDKHVAGSHFFQPTVLTEVSPDSLLCREETFGPVAGLVRFDDESQAIAIANASRAGLAAYVFTRDFERANRVCAALEFGMVGLNTGLISSELAPFGGCKESGIGREGSKYGIDEFLELKTICAEVRSSEARSMR